MGTDRIRTFDLVVADDATASRAAAVVALRHGRRVLVVLRASDRRAARHLRRRLCAEAGGTCARLTVMSGAEVVCVDGVQGVEAVLLRRTASGRLTAVNASAFVSFEDR